VATCFHAYFGGADAGVCHTHRRQASGQTKLPRRCADLPASEVIAYDDHCTGTRCAAYEMQIGRLSVTPARHGTVTDRQYVTR